VAEESEEDTASSSTPRIPQQRILNVNRGARTGPQQLTPYSGGSVSFKH